MLWASCQRFGPCHGGFAPLDPRLPTPVGFGSAGILGPTRGGVANVGNSPPSLKILGAHPPSPLGGGLAPSTPFSHPRGLGVCRRLGLTSPPANPAKFSPFPRREGGQGVRSERHTPTAPAMGASPPGPPFAHPVGLGFASGLGPTRGEVEPFSSPPKQRES